MGYDTCFGIYIHTEDHAVEKEIVDEIARLSGYSRGDIEDGFCGHWYDCTQDLARVSESHPGVIIEVSGDGEASDDVWKARFLDGREEVVRFEGLPPFKEILSDSERENSWGDAVAQYNACRDSLRDAALRQIRRLKDYICYGDGCELSFEVLNRDCPVLTVDAPVALGSGTFRAFIETISADGRTFYDDEGYEIGVDDLSDGDMMKTVSALEEIAREIRREGGTVERSFGEDGICLPRHVDNQNNNLSLS